MNTEHLITIGNSFIEDTWSCTCSCGLEAIDLQDEAEARAVAAMHRKCVNPPEGDE